MNKKEAIKTIENTIDFLVGNDDGYGNEVTEDWNGIVRLREVISYIEKL